MTGGLPDFFLSDREQFTLNAGGKRPGEFDSLQILGGRTKQNQIEEIWSKYSDRKHDQNQKPPNGGEKYGKSDPYFRGHALGRPADPRKVLKASPAPQRPQGLCLRSQPRQLKT